MRLRARLLLLIAVLLAGVLIGSFGWLFSDLRRQFADDIEASLDATVSSFQASEALRFRTLEVMAGSLESSPSFRNVLRATDRATLLDFVESSAQGLQVDEIVVTDAQGALSARTGEVSSKAFPAAAALQVWGGQTPALRHYWWEDGVLYQGASVALVDSQDYIDGYLTVAYRMDQPMLARLARDLDSRLELSAPGSLPSVSPKDFLWRKVALGTAPDAVAELNLGRSLAPIDSFVRSSRLKLGGLALAAFALALAASFPLVGRIANPLEALALAKAEMTAIFEASLDGLLSLDESGRVSLANTAAGVALGLNSPELSGKALSELLPESVLKQFALSPLDLTSRVDFERAGHLFKVHRAFVRLGGGDQLGSILLFHDVTEEHQRERQVTEFLRHLCQRLEREESPWELRVGLSTLAAWTQLARQEASEATSSLAVAPILARAVASFQTALPPYRRCHLQIEPGPEEHTVMMEEAQVRLLVEILLDNSLRHGEGDISLYLGQAGGSLRISVADHGQTGLDLASCLQGPGLGLPVAVAICGAAQGRLEVESGVLVAARPGGAIGSPGDGATRTTRWLATLPRGNS